jgi:hypothetical protein
MTAACGSDGGEIEVHPTVNASWERATGAYGWCLGGAAYCPKEGMRIMRALVFFV